MKATRWRKSLRSHTEDNCVEVAHTLDAVRDSKNRDGRALVVDAAALLAAIKAGRFDR
jgi:hypothetical protein